MPRTYLEFPLARMVDGLSLDLPAARVKLARFERAFYERFPRSSSDRWKAEILVEELRVPTLTYVLGYSGPAIVEVHAILERYTLLYVPRLLTREPRNRAEIEKLIRRRTLGELADTVQGLGLWTEDDARFVRRLKKLRDAIAHKNAASVAKQLGVSLEARRSDLEDRVHAVDCTPLILETIALVLKLVVKRRPGGRNRKAAALRLATA